jgi:hypothetical protein
MYFYTLRHMTNIYSKYDFKTIIDVKILKPGIDDELLMEYNRWLKIEYINDGNGKSKSKIIIKPNLDEILCCKGTIDLLYERFETIIYDMDREEVICTMIPEYAPRKSLECIIENHRDRCNALKRNEYTLKMYEYVKGYTFHLYAEHIEYNSSLNDAMQNLKSTHDHEEWEFCGEEISKHKIDPIEEDIREHYIWNILPDNKYDNNTRLKWIILEFFSTLTNEYQNLLDPELSYVVRFQHPLFHPYCERPIIYILEAFQTTGELEVTRIDIDKIRKSFDMMRDNLETSDVTSDNSDINRVKCDNIYDNENIPIAFPSLISDVYSKEQVIEYVQKIDKEVPGVIVEDIYYNDKIVVFNDSFYNKTLCEKIQKYIDKSIDLLCIRFTNVKRKLLNCWTHNQFKNKKQSSIYPTNSHKEEISNK